MRCRNRRWTQQRGRRLYSRTARPWSMSSIDGGCLAKTWSNFRTFSQCNTLFEENVHLNAPRFPHWVFSSCADERIAQLCSSHERTLQVPRRPKAEPRSGSRKDEPSQARISETCSPGTVRGHGMGVRQDYQGICNVGWFFGRRLLIQSHCLRLRSPKPPLPPLQVTVLEGLPHVFGGYRHDRALVGWASSLCFPNECTSKMCKSSRCSQLRERDPVR